MKHGITAALAVAALAAATSAQAQDNESGFYAGAGVGTFDVEIDDFDDVDDTIDRYDSDDTAWKAFGGWRMNPYLAFELAYVNLGSPDDEILPDTDLTIETDGFAPYVVGSSRSATGSRCSRRPVTTGTTSKRRFPRHRQRERG